MDDFYLYYLTTMNEAWEFLKGKLQSKWPLRGFLGITGLAFVLLAFKPYLMNSNEDSDPGEKEGKKFKVEQEEETDEEKRTRRELIQTLRLMREKEKELSLKESQRK